MPKEKAEKTALAKSTSEQQEPSENLAVSFCGAFSHCVDDNGRISIPIQYREVIQKSGENSIVLTNYISDGARCLDAFTMDCWKQLQSDLRKKGRFDPQVRTLETFYLSRAAVCPLDSNGRITIPVHLRTYASLDKDVTFSAAIHGFRIWNSKIAEMVFQQAEQQLFDDPSMFEKVDI